MKKITLQISSLFSYGLLSMAFGMVLAHVIAITVILKTPISLNNSRASAPSEITVPTTAGEIAVHDEAVAEFHRLLAEVDLSGELKEFQTKPLLQPIDEAFFTFGLSNAEKTFSLNPGDFIFQPITGVLAIDTEKASGPFEVNMAEESVQTWSLKEPVVLEKLPMHDIRLSLSLSYENGMTCRYADIPFESFEGYLFSPDAQEWYDTLGITASRSVYGSLAQMFSNDRALSLHPSASSLTEFREICY